MAEVIVKMPPDALDTLVRAQCKSAAQMLSDAAEVICEYGESADLADPSSVESVAGAVRFCREDLDALARLGIGEAG